MRLRLRLLKISLVNTYHFETAYFAATWFSILNSFFYNIVFVLLIEFVYGNVSSIAGYSQSEMLLIMLLAEIGYFLGETLAYNTSVISYFVNTGSFDFIFLRPIPQLFYVNTRRIRVIETSAKLFSVVGLLAWLIDWSQIAISPLGLLTGSCIVIAGITTWHCLHFLLCLSAFWFGRAEQTANLIFNLEGPRMPYEGMPRWFKTIFIYILPTYISSSLAASAMLGRSDPWSLLAIALGVASTFVYLKLWFWKKALRRYASASS